MAALKRTVALKGQSRSTFCGDKVTGGTCHRLAGHGPKGGDENGHRLTLSGRSSKKSVSAPVIATADVMPDGSIGTVVEVKPVVRRRKTAAKRRRLSPVAAGKLAQAVEDGSVKPSAALSRVAASQRGRTNRPVRVAQK